MVVATDVVKQAEQFREDFAKLRAEIGKVIVGMEEIVDGVLICLFAGGHCLLEGVPGLGKTLLVRTLAQTLDLKFSRIQFTPDLMPADIIGTNMVNESPDGKRYFEFEQGPVFANVILADEINRATPKTQSALLEAMQEHTVTVSGTKYVLDEPFFVLATQNPIEMEGTYPLPEAQLDRFFLKMLVRYPSRDGLCTIVQRTTTAEMPVASQIMAKEMAREWMRLARDVVIAPHVEDYAVRLVLATQPESDQATEMAKKYVRYGSSPRGAQALILSGKIKALLDGRYNVSFKDVADSILPALRHRIILNFEGEAEGITTDAILEDLVGKVPTQARD
ncbi:AAA family ATPase [Candidatus Sumerlaeota bacterium]|nr:AAA family ATPase [Candidatus Sumerlaeota bacterium]